MPRRKRSWGATSRFDIFDMNDGSLVERNVSADDAATYLQVTADEVSTAIAAYSYVDGNGYRAAGHMSVSG
jgi:hypothetical protein